MVLGDMKVVRIHTRNGSHIEPSLDESWTDLTKLSWLAAVINLDIAPWRIVVRSGYGYSKWKPRGADHWIATDAQYNVGVPGAGFGMSPMTYDGAWGWMHAFEDGIRTERRLARVDDTPIFDRLVTRYRMERIS